MLFQLFICFAVVFFAGCTLKSTPIDVPQSITINVPPLSGGAVDGTPVVYNITQTINVRDSAVKTSTDQAADGRGTIPVGFGGGTASGAIGGDSNLDDIRNTATKDESKKDSENPTTDNSDNSVTTPVTTPTPQPTDADVAGVMPESLEGYTVETHELQHMHGDSSAKLFRWLSHTGSYYGKDIIVKFSDGEEWIITDGEYAQAADGNLDNSNQKYWFSGNLLVKGSDTVQKDQSGVLASIFPSPDSKAKIVSLYYKN